VTVPWAPVVSRVATIEPLGSPNENVTRTPLSGPWSSDTVKTTALGSAAPVTAGCPLPDDTTMRLAVRTAGVLSPQASAPAAARTQPIGAVSRLIDAFSPELS
jgi:hypothetical protein